MANVSGVHWRTRLGARLGTPSAGSAGRRWSQLWLVGLTGVAVNQAALLALTELGGLHFLVSAVVATLASTTWNFALADRWVFRDRLAQRSGAARYAAFLAMNLAAQPVRLPVLWGLTVIGLHYGLANLASLAVLALGRAIVADRWIWAPDRTGHTATTAAPEERAETASLPHHYAIDGLLRIASAVRLPELEFFRTEPTIAAPDVVIRVGWVGKMPSRRVRFAHEGDRLVYREQLGALGANFSLRMGTPIEIVVAPLLALSPHVVYTNIVEAFLRFLLVSRGYVLLHAACIANDHGATLISALTDTGKTSTVIKLVRREGYRFLSDDMTIVTPNGEAMAYPKPMTLSFHTLDAARGGRMSLGERLALSVQSRLHSKTGRQVGRALGAGNLPIMTMNAIVQALVPPPKYAIDKLFPCRVGGRAPIRSVVLIERGEPALSQRLSLAGAMSFLVENTDDAYGFPPFVTFAPEIRIGDEGYAALRSRERNLIARAVARIDRWQLRDPDRSWANQLPALMASSPGERGATATAGALTVGPAHGWVAQPAVPAGMAAAVSGESGGLASGVMAELAPEPVAVPVQ